MDKDYDSNNAAKKLEELAFDRYNSTHSGVQLSRVLSVTAHYEPACIGRSWNLVHRNANEELVASFQGIIVKKDLPPFTEKLGRASNHVKYLRQSVSISGFDTSTFNKVVNAIGDIHSVLGRAVGINNVLECGMISTFNSLQVVEMSNRYFKPRQSMSTDDEVALSTDLDPHGYLAKAALAAGLYHSEENVVLYYEREGSGDENYKYKDTKPLIFGIGDIVEVQVSFVMFPLKEGKYKSAMILRGLTLLDGTFTQARVKKMIVQTSSTSGHKTFKRRVGYNDEQISATRAKMARMDVDDHTEEEAEGNVGDKGKEANDSQSKSSGSKSHLTEETLD